MTIKRSKGYLCFNCPVCYEPIALNFKKGGEYEGKCYIHESKERKHKYYSVKGQVVCGSCLSPLRVDNKIRLDTASL